MRSPSTVGLSFVCLFLVAAIAACDRDRASGADLSASPDLRGVPDLRAPADLSSGGDLVSSDDLTVPPDLARPPDLAVGPALEGDKCGQSANGRACAGNLACCYPCGIPGCDWQCTKPCDPGPGCQGGCLLLP